MFYIEAMLQHICEWTLTELHIEGFNQNVIFALISQPQLHKLNNLIKHELHQTVLLIDYEKPMGYIFLFTFSLKRCLFLRQWSLKSNTDVKRPSLSTI
jgi:hypothetical protein